MSTPTPPQIKIYKANNGLQQKAGIGDVDVKKIEKAEKVIENNTEDFMPIAIEFLDRLELGVMRARQNEISMPDRISGMTKPVMELKANALMFKYDLVTQLANIMLGFLENIRELDKDAIDIVSAHHTTLKAIIVKKMKGDGGANGHMLRTELEDACQRYFKRKKTA